MATKKKLLQAAAGNAGGAVLNVEDVFSTYLYTGTGSTLNIVNGIDLDGEGGLVWHKWRGGTSDHGLFDTERGVSRKLGSNNGNAQTAAFSGYGVTAFNSNGYTLGTQYSGENGNGNEVVSWTFRKAPKFFDIVGNITMPSSGSVVVNHNLGSKPGMILLKSTDIANQWYVWHRSVYPSYGKYLVLNSTLAVQSFTDVFKQVTETSFSTRTNSAGTYIAYVFAHHDSGDADYGSGDFGPDGDADIIKCGSYTGNGSSTGPEIDLGFEPQWLMIKEADATGNWQLFDSMRGMVADGVDARIAPNLSNAEDSIQSLTPTATGFKINTTSGNLNTNNSNHIYIAIRRGTAVPTSATDVFAIDTAGGTSPSPPLYNLGKPVDFALTRTVAASSTWNVTDRLRQGKRFRLPNTDAESALSSAQFDYQEGHTIGSTADTNYYSWMWKRAPNFFDVVAYTGDGVIGREVPHNLGVTPELMIQKFRGPSSLGSGAGWITYCAYTTTTRAQLRLDLDIAEGADNVYNWNNTSPTSTHFTVHGGGLQSNYTNGLYITYLFASLDGISKVGSYTGNGSFQTIDCGFSAGARFVLIKRTDATGDWYVWDSLRGITQNADPYLELNTTAAETTGNKNYLYPVSSGFGVQEISGTNNPNINVSSATYIFYAIA